MYRRRGNGASDKRQSIEGTVVRSGGSRMWPKVEVVPEECAERDRDIPLELVLSATLSTLFVDLFISMIWTDWQTFQAGKLLPNLSLESLGGSCRF